MALALNCIGLCVDDDRGHDCCCDDDLDSGKLDYYCSSGYQHLVQRLAMRDLFPSPAHSFYGEHRYAELDLTIGI